MTAPRPNSRRRTLPAPLREALARLGIAPAEVQAWARRPDGQIVLRLTNGMKLVLKPEVKP